MTDLDAALLAAHTAGDSTALVAIYQQAASETPDLDNRAFLLTHAYVFALETDHADAPALRAELIALGREVPLSAPQPKKA